MPDQGNDKNKYYVYMPCDDNDKPFYIGKGERGRENGALEKRRLQNVF